jgi:uncharacterized radical SAM superfamily Fe-S cluster-containing enzyme
MKTDRTYLNSTLAYCNICKKTELARIVTEPTGVYMERVCLKLGVQRVKIASDYHWYRERIREGQSKINSKPNKESQNGCPMDCGICDWHANDLQLPVFSITNVCNLDCPKCFTYNRPDKMYYKSPEDTRKILRHILNRKGQIQLINITGGEPTLHPRLLRILEVCKEEKIHRITMNTNGLRLAKDKALAKGLKNMGVQLVLSLDTLDPEKSKIIHGRDITGEKRKALEVIEELDIPITILMVCIKNINHEEVADLTQTYLKKNFVRSITIQNMTYTGKNGSTFSSSRERITLDEVEKLLSSKKEFNQGDFFPLGSYHPLCYSVAYYFISGQRLISFSRILSRDVLKRISEKSYLINPRENVSREFMEGLNRLWGEGEDEELLKELKILVREIYPMEQRAVIQDALDQVEKKVKMIYIHPHMDEDNFDIDRVSRCGDLVPDEQGNMIPACSYNLIYRQRDPRFWVEPYSEEEV